MIERLLPSFARRIARTLRPRQAELMAELLPQLKFNFSPLQHYKMLEIGFGNGEHLLDFAIKNPDFCCYGAEPFINGVASLLVNIAAKSVPNILIHNDDVRLLFKDIPNSFFNEIYIICPDPWQKRRQVKRRLINSDLLKSLSKILTPDGHLTIVTDHKDYASWILKAIIDSKVFFVPSEKLEDYTSIPDGFIQTKYQKRGVDQGFTVHYFRLTIIHNTQKVLNR